LDRLAEFGTDERAMYLRRRAILTATELLRPGHEDVEDLASDIVLALLRQDHKAHAEGASVPPKYLRRTFRWVGIDALRLIRRSRDMRAPIFVTDGEHERQHFLVDHDTPEEFAIAAEAVRDRLPLEAKRAKWREKRRRFVARRRAQQAAV